MNPGVVSENDHFVYFVSERAYLLQTEGHFRESLALFEGLLELNPDNLYCRDAISGLHLSLGNYEQAIEYASSVIAASPGHIYAIMRRCEGYIRLRQKDHADRDLRRLKHLQAFKLALRMEMRFIGV